MLKTIIFTSITLSCLGLLLGFFLSIASKKFSVKPNPRLSSLTETLPGTNCGACGFASCFYAAQAVAENKASDFTCIAGGEEVATNVSKIMGLDMKIKEPKIAIVKCRGGKKEAKDKYQYFGVKSCFAASKLNEGPKSCSYGCLGFSDCIDVCPFDAIKLNNNNIPVVDREKCTGCGKCVKACPTNIIELASTKSNQIIWCNSHDKGVIVKDICDVGCIACNICVKSCPFEAITMENFLAKIDYEKCTYCGICVTKCPHGTILETEKVADTLVIK